MKERVLSEVDEERSMPRLLRIVLTALVVATVSAIVAAFAAAGTANADGATASAQGVQEGQYQDGSQENQGRLDQEDVPEGKYPFVASLQDVSLGGKPRNQHFCGGALISPRHVITAAHCVGEESIGNGKNETKLEDLRIVVGRAIQNSDEGQVREVENKNSIHVHPKYKAKGLNSDYDVAVVELSRPVEGIEPVELAGPETDVPERPVTEATVAGWGVLPTKSADDQDVPQEDSKYPDRQIQETKISVYPDEKCEKVYNSGEESPIYSSDVFVCAEEFGIAAGAGISGGPLFTATDDDEYRQIGVFSGGYWPEEDEEAKTPGIYTEVGAEPIKNFIREATGV